MATDDVNDDWRSWRKPASPWGLTSVEHPAKGGKYVGLLACGHLHQQKY